MAGEPYKVNQIMTYTETVYFDGDDNEVARVRIHDDSWHDSEAPQPLEPHEMEDHFPDYEEEG